MYNGEDKKTWLHVTNVNKQDVRETKEQKHNNMRKKQILPFVEGLLSRAYVASENKG